MPSAIDRTTPFQPARSHAAEIAQSPTAGSAEKPETGPFHGLFQKHDTLERLIADAGPLGQFKTDQPDQMPSGTSALTTRVSDVLNQIASRLGVPVERILSANPSLAPVAHQRAVAEMPPGHGPTAPRPGQQIQDPRPAVATEAGNRTAPHDRGNRAPGRA